jgi:hypothetical protein
MVDNERDSSFKQRGNNLISCHIRYEIDPDRVEEFGVYAKMWIVLVKKFGGIHHGCFYRQKAVITQPTYL